MSLSSSIDVHIVLTSSSKNAIKATSKGSTTVMQTHPSISPITSSKLLRILLHRYQHSGMSISQNVYRRHLHATVSGYIVNHTKHSFFQCYDVSYASIRNFSKRGKGRKRRTRPRPDKSQLEWTRIIQNCTQIVRNSAKQQQKLNDCTYSRKLMYKRDKLNLSADAGKIHDNNNIHNVSKRQKLKYKDMLLDFKNNPWMDRLEIPPDLTKAERSVLHMLAKRLHMSSKSFGEGESRRIIISCKAKNHARGIQSNGSNLLKLDIGVLGAGALEKYIQLYPSTDAEIWSAQGSSTEIETDHFSLERRRNQDASLWQKARGVFKRFVDFADSNSKKATDLNHGTTESMRQVANLQRRAYLHRKMQADKENNFNYEKMQAIRAKLPAYKYQNDICEAIQSNRVTILAGSTGCGKSTQVPQFILDSSVGPTCKIAVTQPRRISAISLADRVASERCEGTGRTVGYSVRMDTSVSEATQLLYLTPGVLLKKVHSDPELDEFTHVIIDEIHERDKVSTNLYFAFVDHCSKSQNESIVSAIYYIVAFNFVSSHSDFISSTLNS